MTEITLQIPDWFLWLLIVLMGLNLIAQIIMIRLKRQELKLRYESERLKKAHRSQVQQEESVER